VDDPAGASSQQREECRCGLLLTVEVPAKQVCSPVGDRVIVQVKWKKDNKLAFSTYVSLYFENDTRYGHIYNGRLCDLLNGAISNDLA